jgi:hypothetical protein
VDLTLELFAPLVGDTFTIRAADGEIEAVLASADPGTPAPAGHRQPFSLVWRAPADVQLQQGTHVVEHPAIDAEAVFLVPIGAGPDGIEYQAIFS